MQQQLTRQQRRAAERKTNKIARKAAAAKPTTAPETTIPTPSPSPISPAQLAANRANAQLSTGPSSEEGKAIVSINRLTHGLTGKFTVLDWEDESQYQDLLQSLHDEHQPTSETETRLVDSIARHYWLMQRALNLQDELLLAPELDERRFSLYLRYQTTNERAYYRAQRELATIRKEKRREQIGFESQKRAQELHEAKVRLINARAAESEVETEVRCTMEAPLPGHTRVPLLRENAFAASNHSIHIDKEAAA